MKWTLTMSRMGRFLWPWHPENKPFRDASRKAFLKVFRRVAYALSMTALIGLVALYFAWQANSLAARQNEIVRQQTELLIAQNQVALASEIPALLADINGEQNKAGYSCYPQPGSDWKEIDERGLYRLSTIQSARAIALSLSFRPYHVVNISEDEQPRSPERGYLLLALLSCSIDMGPIYYAKRKNLWGAGDIYTRRADFSMADLRGADLTECDLRMADLRGADLSHSYLKGADCAFADLRGVDFSEAYCAAHGSRFMLETKDGFNHLNPELRGPNMVGANLKGAKISKEQLLLCFTDQETVLPDGSYGPARPDTPEERFQAAAIAIDKIERSLRVGDPKLSESFRMPQPMKNNVMPQQ